MVYGIPLLLGFAKEGRRAAGKIDFLGAAVRKHDNNNLIDRQDDTGTRAWPHHVEMLQLFRSVWIRLFTVQRSHRVAVEPFFRKRPQTLKAGHVALILPPSSAHIILMRIASSFDCLPQVHPGRSLAEKYSVHT